MGEKGPATGGFVGCEALVNSRQLGGSLTERVATILIQRKQNARVPFFDFFKIALRFGVLLVRPCNALGGIRSLLRAQGSCAGCGEVALHHVEEALGFRPAIDE